MRFVELFAGAGGLSLGLERAGLRCVAHAEIESHARAVLRRHWPDVPLYGDVSQLRGADFPPCDLLSGGSPCQDLSVAGKRAGLVDGVRSSLFFHQARLWDESDAPYFLWENVAGALSSNAGRDFALVLSTLVGAPVAVPGDGWRRGGVASGPAAVAAWRVCDLRYFGPGGFGPPQRRVRVFVLAARAGAADPAEILALRQGVCGHPDPRQSAGEGAAAEVGSSVAGSLRSGRAGGHRTDLDNAGCYPVQPMTFKVRGRSDGSSCEVREDGTVSSLLTPNGGRAGTGAGDAIITGHTTHAPTGEGCDASEDGTGRGTPLVAQPFGWDQRNVTSAANRTRVTPGMVGTIHADGGECAQPWPDVAPTLDARDAKGPGNYHNGELQATVVQDRPRRLMPLECERLMGWPDDHTAEGIAEDGTAYRLKDTPRYRLCGNGCGAPVLEWIGRRLVETISALAGAGRAA